MSKREEILKKIIRIANEKYPDSEVYLYGSRARKDFSNISDWDLLILLNSNISFDIETKILDEFYELELETGEIISPLVYSKSEWINNYQVTPLYENIQKDGIKLK